MALWRSAVRSRLGPPDEPPPRAIARGFSFDARIRKHVASGLETVDFPRPVSGLAARGGSRRACPPTAELQQIFRNWMLHRPHVTEAGTFGAIGRARRG